MALFEIKHRWDGSVLFSIECGSFKIAFQAYIKAQVAAGAKCGPVHVFCEDLSGVDFVGSRFVGSSFVGSRFEDSRFEDSRFEGSSFVGSSFVGSSFEDSRFEDSSFVGSSFVGSSFVGSRFEGSSFVDSRFEDSRFEDSSFVGSSFVGSSFVGSRFEGSRFEDSRFVGSRFDNAETTLSGLDLMNARDDVWKVLSVVPDEVPGLRLALTEGRIDGSHYEGECACLVGTIGNLKHCHYGAIPGLAPNSSRPSEQFFLSIRKGDTPENSYFAKLAVQWIDEWAAKNPQPAPATV